MGPRIGLSVFGSLLARHISDGVSGLADQLPAGTASHIATGGIPQGLAPDLLVKVQTVFAGAFQNIFTISLGFVIAAFFICWFLKKEVLSKKRTGIGRRCSGAGPGGTALRRKADINRVSDIMREGAGKVQFAAAM
ncbi:hypothetical protein HMSSN036_91770 [Paenibacillus macerans]|nr:hypothetical protein HMSSN036_91770 [Paenibacillus macerans]